MICDKIQYNSYQEAKKVVNKAHKKKWSNGVRNKKGPQKRPARPYLCDVCGKWHLTSQKTNKWKSK